MAVAIVSAVSTVASRSGQLTLAVRESPQPPKSKAHFQSQSRTRRLRWATSTRPSLKFTQRPPKSRPTNPKPKPKAYTTKLPKSQHTKTLNKNNGKNFMSKCSSGQLSARTRTLLMSEGGWSSRIWSFRGIGCMAGARISRQNRLPWRG
jgi:hypothetical protein